MIVEADKSEWAGAGSKLVPPITAGDCLNTPDFQGLVRHEMKPGRGCTVRAGVAFARRMPAQIEAMCDLSYPFMYGVTPSSGVSPLQRHIGGVAFGAVAWKVYVSRFPTWALAVDKQLQEIVSWEGGAIDFICDVHCQGTGIWYVFVENESQQHTATGKAVEVTACS